MNNYPNIIYFLNTANRKVKLLFLSLLLFAIQAVAQKVENKSYSGMLYMLLSHSGSEISVSDIKSDSDFIFIDARERKEYDVSHIKNAIWCGYDKFDIKRLKTISKNKKMVVYCSVGYRSEKITEKLVKAGYNSVSNLYGGIFEWKNEGRIVYDNDGKPTEKVHAYSHTWGMWLNKGEKIYD